MASKGKAMSGNKPMVKGGKMKPGGPKTGISNPSVKSFPKVPLGQKKK